MHAHMLSMLILTPPAGLTARMADEGATGSPRPVESSSSRPAASPRRGLSRLFSRTALLLQP